MIILNNFFCFLTVTFVHTHTDTHAITHFGGERTFFVSQLSSTLGIRDETHTIRLSQQAPLPTELYCLPRKRFITGLTIIMFQCLETSLGRKSGWETMGFQN